MDVLLTYWLVKVKKELRRSPFTRILWLICLMGGLAGRAQNNASREEFHEHHSLGILISHTQVFQGVQSNGERKWLALPSIGLNYNYKFHPIWAIGLHNDIVIEDFEVEQHLRSGGGNDNEILQRSYPLASVLVASYKPGKSFNYMFGAGGEFAHTGTLFLIRIGIEYVLPISKYWEFNLNLVNDLKLNAYNSVSYGVGITKIF